MSSQALAAQEVLPVPSAHTQALESSNGGAVQISSTSTPCALKSVEEADIDAAAPVAPPSTSDTGSATAVTISPPVSSSIARATHGTASDSLKDPVRAKFVSSPGYVVPAPSFSYSVFPRVNSASGIPQQTSSAAALKLTPPMSPAALQPPVPGQSLGNRPSFSYNIVPLPNASPASGQHSPASGQQLQPTTGINQRQLFIGNPAPAQHVTSCLQPPVPRPPVRLTAAISGTLPPNLTPRVQLPVPFPKGQLSPSSFSFGGVLQKPLPSGAGTPDPLSLDASKTSVSTNIDSKSSHDTCPSSSVGSTMSPVSSTSSTFSPTVPLMAARPLVPGAPSHNVSKASTLDTAQSSTPVSITAINRPPSLPNQTSVPLNQANCPNPTQQNALQSIYPHFPVVSAMTPPQSQWSHPQAGGFQRPPFLQYPGIQPSLFSLQAKSILPPTTPNVHPPGVSTELNPEEVPTSKPATSIPGNNAVVGSSPHNDGHEKESNDVQEDGNSKNEDLESWTVHKTDTGVIYYYNTLSGESTYERPSNFKGEPEKTAVQIIPVSWEKIPGTNWTLVTTNDGKKYYYNTMNKVSSWQVPAEVLEVRKNQEVNSSEDNTSISADKGATSSSLSTPALHTGGRDSMVLRTASGQACASALDLIKKKLQDSVTPTITAPFQTSVSAVASDLNGSKVVDASNKGQQPANSKDKVKDANGDGNMSDSSSDSDDGESGPTKEECITHFKDMLKERGVAPFSKWEKELPKIVFDPRFKAVPSYSARRAIFEQYVRTRAEEERKEKKAAQKAAICGFKQLLEEALEDIHHNIDFHTFKRKWSSDQRFEALDRKERELLFNEKVLQLKKAAEEKNHAVRAVAVNSFKSMLKERCDINTSTRWSKVKESLRNDPRYKIVNYEDRETLFNDYIAELKAVEHEVERAAKAKKDEQDKLKEREREMRKRKEREEQEMERIRLKVRRKEVVTSYQSLLVETIKDPKASWTESKPRLEKDPQGRATNPDLNQADAEKLFRDHVKDLYERCVRDFRTLLSEVLTADAAARTTAGERNAFNSWSEAKHVLKPDPRYSKMPRKDREALWLRYVEEMMRKQKAGVDTKEKVEPDGKNRSPADVTRRSHGRR